MAAITGWEATSDNPAAAVWTLPTTDGKLALTCVLYPAVCKASNMQ